MPPILYLTCNNKSCGKTIRSWFAPVVILNNGERHVLPHPQEERMCEEWTGCSIAEIESKKRFGHRGTWLCLSCGNVMVHDQKHKLPRFLRSPSFWDDDNASIPENFPDGGPTQCSTPECSSNDIVSTFEASGKTCPWCKKGRLKEWMGGFT